MEIDTANECQWLIRAKTGQNLYKYPDEESMWSHKQSWHVQGANGEILDSLEKVYDYCRAHERSEVGG